MMSIYIIIAGLTTTALANGALKCNLSEPTGAQRCFGALAEPLTFYLPNGENKKLMLTKNHKKRIFKILNNAVASIDKEYHRSAFFSNGTFKLEKATKQDSGHYQLETYRATDGVLLHKINMSLEIQAPVSKPVVSQMCLSSEQMIINCSSEGDGVELIFTLDGYSLIQTRSHCQTNWTAVSQSPAGDAAKQDKFSGSNVSMNLYGQLTGNLMCQVRNSVSRNKTVLQLTSCKGFISHSCHVTMAVIASAATLLLLLALFLGIKYFNKKTRPMTITEDNAEDEIVYSDVRVMKHTRKSRPNLDQNAL
ncbi:uncharacterized protein LOC119894816 isoform X1 [Micropterus salmoides]|uniref:uncharacterized protein LOC119894816 isoform X1 n=1 Tax=Micropterus salmoides TaxID=27706 RepID=UPI0018EC04B2|nr:uncharacterized protein LOC119894816 isoform X1 [Micropterus salmoides]XP_038563428.1 uncharacterized protein LOC119894816 isoform X1 [Micropterus salmoides]